MGLLCCTHVVVPAFRAAPMTAVQAPGCSFRWVWPVIERLQGMQLLLGHGMAGSLMQKVQAQTQVLTPSRLNAQTIRHNGLLVLHLGSSKQLRLHPQAWVLGVSGQGSGFKLQLR